MSSVVARAIALVRTHPDVERVRVILDESDTDTRTAVDTKQMERAVLNLLLNACQSARESAGLREVRASLHGDQRSVSVTSATSVPTTLNRNNIEIHSADPTNRMRILCIDTQGTANLRSQSPAPLRIEEAKKSLLVMPTKRCANAHVADNGARDSRRETFRRCVAT